MYFLQQVKRQFMNQIIGSLHPTETKGPDESIKKETSEAQKPAEKAAEVKAGADDLRKQTSKNKVSFQDQQSRIEGAIAGEKGSETLKGNGGNDVLKGGEGTDDLGASNGTEGITAKLEKTPATPNERYAAMAKLEAAGIEITDETIASVVVNERGESGEIKELTPEEQAKANEQALSSMAADIGMNPETLQKFYKYSNVEGNDNAPQSLEEMEQFANKMDKFQKLLERTGQKLPVSEEDFNKLMEQLTDENGNIHIPLTQEEAEAQGFVFNDDGSIDFDNSPAYASIGDSPAGQAYVRNGKVNSGFRGSASVSRLSDAELNELPGGVDGLLTFISHAEGTVDNYNAEYGKAKQSSVDYTQMTLLQIRTRQRQMVKENGVSSAMGKYQIMGYTLDDYCKANRINMATTKFDKEFQDNFAKRKLVERGLNDYMSTGDVDKFQAKLAMEWASIPKDASGRSHYADDGINGATVSHQQIQTQIKKLREA